MSDRLFAFYGDDFTGSVDALLQFTRHGLRTRLFVGVPSGEELARAAAEFDVIGVAGIGRSLPPAELAAELAPVLTAFAGLGADVVQYKACSTADSSPELGSLGRVIELGRELVAARPVPLLFAQPDFGRYTVFGHHFAAEGDTVYRLDRQPTMSTHPATPMRESDLARHLALQTRLPISNLPFTAYGSADDIAERVRDSESAAVVLDAFADEQLPLLGAAVLALPAPVFAIGSGGLSRALAEAAAAAGATTGATGATDATITPPHGLAAPGPTLAVSGSRSTQTRRQFEAAEASGWRVLPLPVGDAAAVSGTAATVVELLASGADVALSSLDARFDAQATVLPAIAESAAHIVAAAAQARATRRVIVCGGDTSSRVTSLLGVRSLSIAANPWGNVVLLEAHAPGSAIDGLELLLKGGQVGGTELFREVRQLGA